MQPLRKYRLIHFVIDDKHDILMHFSMNTLRFCMPIVARNPHCPNISPMRAIQFYEKIAT